MKRFILLLTICFICGNNVYAFSLKEDTTIYLDNKKIEITETEDRSRVKLYEMHDSDGYVELEKVFEGHYRDGKSYERRKYISIPVAVPTFYNPCFKGHWGGFGIGFANFADSKLHVNDINGVSLRGGNSMEYNFNFFSWGRAIKGTRLGVFTGLGMRWSRYKVAGNNYFQEQNGYTSLHSLPSRYTMKTSKLNITSLTIPVMFEWQPGGRKKGFFFSAGAIGVIKTISSSKIVYYNENGKKQKQKVDGGMNILPVSVDFMLQTGINKIGMYTKYSPVGLFAQGKGPKVHPVSIGLQYYW